MTDEVSLGILAIAVLVGAIAGFINTLAGSGSLVTLPMLIFMGLPANVANGTNRIGVIFQNIVGMIKFRRTGNLDLEHGGVLIVPTVIGALVGSLIAVDIDEQLMRYVIAAAMLVMLVVILMNPKQWLKEHSDLSAEKTRSPLTMFIFFLVGVYGGFIQAGVGVFLLVSMVMRCGFNMVQANGIKLALVLIFSLPALFMFAVNDQVHWFYGIVMALGQGIGAWLAATFASESKSAPIWIRRLLITVIVLSILKLFGVLDYLIGLF